MNKKSYVKGELFHIIHSAIFKINEKRAEKDKIKVLDKEIGEAIDFLEPNMNEVFKEVV